MRWLLIWTVWVVACRSPQPELVELRGVWLTNIDSQVLDSRANIAEAMQFLADHHFNIVYPVVWNDAKTLYPSALMDSLFGLPIDPRFAGRDPLAEVVEEAHQRGIAVVPWFEYGFSSSYRKDGGMILAKYPHWAARDREGKLLIKNGFEWMNAYHPEVQNLLLGLVLEVVRNYAVDGVQGDDRLPAQPIEGGYSEFTQKLYASEHGGKLPPWDYRDPQWQHWRGDKLNRFVKRLFEAVKAIKPQVLVTWSPSVYDWSYDEYLQDYPTWIREGHAELVHPQVYRYDLTAYQKTLLSQCPDSLKIDPTRVRMYPGILMNVGSYIIDPGYLLQAIEFNRRNGYNGEVFFFYEGLRKNQNALADTLLKTWYRQPARLPFRIASLR